MIRCPFTADNGNNNKDDDSSVSAGAVVAIVVGAIVVLALIGVLAACYIKRQRMNSQQLRQKMSSANSPRAL